MTTRFASVVPFALNEKGNVFILISQEAFGKDKGKWSSFAGKTEKSESPLESASREFFEESSGLFGTRSMLKQILQRRGIAVESSRKNGLHYLLEIPFDPSLPSMFSGTRASLRAYVHAVTGKHELPYAPFIEKSKLAWVPLSRIPKKFVLRNGFAGDLPVLTQALRQYTR